MTRELLHGTLDVMILKALSWGGMHGFGIGRWIDEQSEGRFKIEEGSLYPALYRLERKEWIEAEWGLTENNRRAKYYRLTSDGGRQLSASVTTWSDFAGTVARILTTTQEPSGVWR
jgi:transcriptional regulator